MLYFRSFTAVKILPLIAAAVICSTAINASAEPAATSPPGGNTKAGVFDDSVKPVDPNKNTKAGEFDDSIRPIDPAGIAGKSSTFDDSVKPVDPGTNPKAGNFDDSVKPVDPGKPPKAVKGTEASATAIEYGKTAEPDAKKPDEK
jgi:hypothetical protein